MYVKMCFTIAMLALLIIPLAVHADNGRYYVYQFERVDKGFKNSEKTFEKSFRTMLRYEAINDTAYRVEVVEYNASIEDEKKAFEYYLTWWMNWTGGVEKPIRDIMNAPVFLHVISWAPPIWIEPHTLAETKETVTKINNALNELCSITDLGQRTEKLRNLWNLFNSTSGAIATSLFPSIIYLDLEFLCKGGFSYTAEETKNTYVFRTSLSKVDEKYEGVVVYSKQGWLINMNYKKTQIINGSKVVEIVNTVRLVDTNDPALASTAKGGIQPSQSPMQIVVTLAVAGVVAVLGAIAIKILVKQIKR